MPEISQATAELLHRLVIEQGLTCATSSPDYEWWAERFAAARADLDAIFGDPGAGGPPTP